MCKNFWDVNRTGANQPLCVTMQTSNLNHMTNIKGAWVDWVILHLTARPNHTFANPLPLPLFTPLDVDPVAQIEVCTVCTNELVCT